MSKETNARAKEKEFLTDNRNCVTNVSALLSCAVEMRARSFKVMLCCQSQQLSPSGLSQIFSFLGRRAVCWEERAKLSLPKLAYKDLDKHVLLQESN